MKFDLKVLPDETRYDLYYERVEKRTELTIDSADFIREFEADKIQCMITMREMFFMYHLPFGYTAQVGDEIFYRLYHTLKARPEVISGTIHSHEVDSTNSEDYRKRARHVEFDFTLNTKEEQERCELLEDY